MCFSQWLRDSWRWVAETLIHCFLVETSGWIQRCHGVRWKLPQRPECCTTPAWLLWRIRVSTHTMAEGTQCLLTRLVPPLIPSLTSPVVNRSILFITTTAQWGIKGKENGDRLLKNIYTLWKINIFQLKFISDRDYPEKATEVCCFLFPALSGLVTSASGAAPSQQRTRWRKNAPRRRKKKKSKSIPAQQMEPRVGEEEEESGEG